MDRGRRGRRVASASATGRGRETEAVVGKKKVTDETSTAVEHDQATVPGAVTTPIVTNAPERDVDVTHDLRPRFDLVRLITLDQWRARA